MTRIGSLNYAQKNCVASAGKLMQQTNMLFPGARVGVALSGGMDSWTLLQTLLLRQRITPFAFEIMVLHVNPGFDVGNHAPATAWLAEHGVAAHLEVADHGPRAHSDENRKNSACFFCCRLRRNVLFDLCRRYGLTHLALGHNSDDLAATFFMNMFQTGRVEGLSIKEAFFGGRLTMIRPLLWVDKATIRRACAAWGLPVWHNPCPSADHTARSRTTAWLQQRFRENSYTKQNVFNALRRWQLDLTPGVD
ncbi:MAG: ATP-binding protein [Desulfovibrionaceae bacterium]